VLADPTSIRVAPDFLAVLSNGSTTEHNLAGKSPSAVRPFLKWAGGKQWLAPLAATWLPSDFSGTYYEPFVGGGSIFFAAAPGKAVLSDRCGELITAFRAVRDDVDAVIKALKTYPHTHEFFLTIRDRTPRTPHTQAARLIYLNKTAFNGLYRVNHNGKFNVPFGRYRNPTICNETRLRAAASILKNVDLRAGDFEVGLDGAVAGDFVYIDPPYITGHQNNGFLKYNAALFSWEDQKRLSRLAAKLREDGVTVVISNSDHQSVLDLYPGYFHYRLERRSLIGGAGSQRGQVSEALLTSTELDGVPTRMLNG
jgi:DNA adenine methylase